MSYCTDSYIYLPKKGYVTSFVPESTCFYVAASRQSMNKRYIVNPFPAGQGSPLLLWGTNGRFHGGTIYNDAASGLIWVENQVSLGSSEIIMGKERFEQWLYDITCV